MHDQAIKLRQMVETGAIPVRTGAPGVPMIVVFGARAGVGTTTVAVNLAAALSNLGERVVLVDAAVNGNLAEAAGIGRADIKHTLSEVISGECRVVDAIVSGPVGMSVLAAASHVNAKRDCAQSPRRNLDRSRSRAVEIADNSRSGQQRLMSELQSLRNEVDGIVLDTGSGWASWSRRYWAKAKHVLLVSTSEDAALMNAYAAIKRSVSDAIDSDVRVILNQCDKQDNALAACQRLSKACQRFLERSVAALPALPRDIDVDLNERSFPRWWEARDTTFGHAALWLGRAVSDLLQEPTTSAGGGAMAAKRLQVREFQDA